MPITSPNPRARRAVNFHYFEKGTDASGDDLQSVVEGVSLVRRMTDGMRPALIAEEELPADDVQTDPEPGATAAIGRRAITRPARARFGPESAAASSRAISRCTAPIGFASSMPRRFRGFLGWFIVSAV